MASNVDSLLDIYNLALGAAGAPGRISQANEESREREICERWYDLARTRVQEAAFFPSSKAIQSLALLGTRDYNVAWTESDPPPQYKYKYALPSDYLRARNLSDYSRFDIVWSVDRRVLVCNCDVAVLEYTRDSELVSNWTPGEQQAITFALATLMGPELTGKRANIERSKQAADEIIMSARVDAANATENLVDHEVSWLTARGYAEGQLTTRYFYPYGPSFAEGAQISA